MKPTAGVQATFRWLQRKVTRCGSRHALAIEMWISYDSSTWKEALSRCGFFEN